MKKTIQLINHYHWLWLAVAAPFLLFPSPKRSLILLIVPAILLLNIGLARQKNTPQPPFPLTPFNSAILLLALMILVSTWATYDIAFSLPKISGLILGIAIFYAVARESQTERRFWLSVTGFLILGVGVAGLGLIGTDWMSSKLAILNPITARIPALIPGMKGAESGFHPNEIAGALIWTLPLFGTLSLAVFKPLPGQKTSHSWLLRLGLWLAALFVAAVFILSQSRSGYLGLAFTGLIIVFMLLPSRWRWGLLVVLLGAAIIVSLAFSAEDFTAASDWLVGSGITTEATLSLNTLEGRFEIWSRAIYGLQDFPFTGMGMNTFRQVVHVLYPLFTIAPNVDFGHAHNEFLQAGLDLGLPGLIAFIALYLAAFGMLAQIWRLQRAASRQLLSIQALTILGLGGGLLAHLLYGFTDAVALGAKPGIIFWWLLGLIAGLHNRYFLAATTPVQEG